MKAQTSRSPQRRAAAAPLRRKLIAVLVATCYSTAQAGPVNPSVVAGQASFNLTGKTYSITNTPNTIINWQSFSLASDEVARFIQQSADSKVLNRITGQDPTRILGSLQSNGKVFLINPNGVLFGAGSRVDVNGLVASSLAISNADFLAGKNNFSGAATAGKVSNAGAITTPSGGQIFLIAPAVENSGVISSPNGDVVLAAGHSVQLFDSKDPNVQVVVSAPADLALNLGQIVAQSGRVGVYGALVSQRGGISANSAVRGANGQIILKSSGTTLLEAGSTTTATGSNLNTGGDIRLLGAQVGLTGDAVVDASGAAGGGSVLVGGDYQGRNAAVQNAQQSYVGKDAVIKADATGYGDGGKVIVWSDKATQVFGSISARGGAAGGNGGFVETSGHYLDMQGNVDTRAPKGATGKLLLDPTNIYIASGSGDAITQGMVSTGFGTLSGSGPFLEIGLFQDSLLLTTTLQNALNNNTVTVSTANVSGSGNGDITVASALAFANGGTLSLNADRDIKLKAPITGTGVDLALTAGRTIDQSTQPIDALTIHSLNAMAVTDIKMDNEYNTFGGSASLQTTNGNATLTAVNLTLGNSNIGGTLAALAKNGDLTVSGNVSSGGDMTLTSTKADGLITLNNGVAVGSSSGNITVKADNMALAGTLSAITGHGVLLTPYTASTEIQVGVGATDGAGVLGLSQAELVGVTLPSNGSLTVGGSSNGPGNGTSGLTVVGNLDLTGGQNAGSLTLQTGGGDLTINNGAAINNTGVISLQTPFSGDHRITNHGSVTSVSNINLNGGQMTLAGGSLNGTSISLYTANAVNLGLSGSPSNTLALTNADLASAHPSGGTLFVTNDNHVAPGNIVVSQPLTLSNTLNLAATGNIDLQAALTLGGLTLHAGSDITATGAVTVNGVFNLDAGNWSQVGSLPAFSAYDFRIGGNGNFVRAAAGDGSSGAPYQVVDVYGLQGVGSLSRSSQSYVLNNDIDASETAHWNQTGPSAFSGFKPIGDLDHSYSGTFNGNHKTISGLNIYRPGSNHIGLFSVLGSGAIQDVKLTGATVEGGGYTGLLVGSINNGGSVSGVAIESNVIGNDAYVGGLAGYSSGSISNSFVVGNVTGTTANSSGKTGGLLGGLDTYGSLSATYSSGAVKSNTNDVVNALVGDGGNGGSVASSFFLTSGPTSDSAGAVGLTSTQIKQQASFSGFDFASAPVWRIYEGHTTPLLKAFLTPLTATVTGPGSTKVYDGLPGSYAQAYSHPDVSGTMGYIGGVNVGTYQIATGLYSTKYDISYSGSAPLVVTPATLSVSLASRQYDNTTNATLSGAGLVGVLHQGEGPLDSVTLVAGEGSFVSFANKNVGVDKTVTLSGSPLGLSGASAGNYMLGASPTVKGTITARTASTWTGNSSNGLWSDAGNWASSIAPDGANVLSAVIGASAGTITYAGGANDATLKNLTVGSGSQLELTGGTLTIASGGSKSYLTGATLNLNGGGLVLNGAMEATSLTLTNGVLSGTNSAANLTVNNLTQTGGSINMSGSLTVNSFGNIAVGTLRAQNGITLNAGESGSISQTGALTADSLHVMASSGVTLTNTGNHVGAFYGSNGSGGIQLNNTVASGELQLGPLSSSSGNIVIDNHGGIHTAGTIVASNGKVTIAAHSPVTINDSISGSDIELSASTDITLNSGSNLQANNTISLAAINNIVLGGHLAVSASGSISAVATNGSISVGSPTDINSHGGAVTLAAPFGSVSAASVTLNGVVPNINSGGAAAAQAAADAAAKAAADAAAKAAADAAAKAAADAAAKAAADAAAKAAADAAAKAAADAAAKAAADAAAKAAADAAADAAAKAAADAAAKAAADAAAHAAADAAAKAAADAAAKAAADAAAKAAADAAAASGNQAAAPVAQALNTTVNIINTITQATNGKTSPAVATTPDTVLASNTSSGGGNSKPDDKVPDEKDKSGGKVELTANKLEPTKKMYCN
ncbi:filamentous hemeagglutinin domain containing protein [Janthinobacterium sp. HH01]|uniref:two-partner secretion domain-containing protein n=1 Tax=Janthinobacterium sp. HH01 TaxID=1198452 RepID=UPI0002AE8624|nr:filamentous hemagglutinin N-terminal domain-containing protein [Janthinobacterium sp. HH01]ELX10052.1 filamentous hemeagglutinin domain containing protein [Janthinobacterium sp. HH01]